MSVIYQSSEIYYNIYQRFTIFIKRGQLTSLILLHGGHSLRVPEVTVGGRIGLITNK